MASPRVSFIVPAYNSGDTIAETLESVVQQTFQDWEMVVIDDGSQDATASIVDELQERQPRVRLSRNGHHGASQARNSGLGIARGDWVVFLDSDDWISADYLDQMLRASEENPAADVLYCDYSRVAEDGNVFPMKGADDISFAPRKVFAYGFPIAIHCFLLKKRILLDVGGFDTTLKTCEDWELWQRIAATGAKFVRVPRHLSFYRMRQGSLSMEVEQVLLDATSVLARVPRREVGGGNGSPQEPFLSAEESTFCLASVALWSAAVDLANGRFGSNVLDRLSSLPDLKDRLDFAVQPLFEGLVEGRRCHPGDLAYAWPELVGPLRQILDRLERSSTRPGLGGQILRALEARLIGASTLEAPVTLQRTHGRRLDLLERLPAISIPSPVDCLHLRLASGEQRVGDIVLPVLGTVTARDLAESLIEASDFRTLHEASGMRTRLTFWISVTLEIGKAVLSSMALVVAPRGTRASRLRSLWTAIRAKAWPRAASGIFSGPRSRSENWSRISSLLVQNGTTPESSAKVERRVSAHTVEKAPPGTERQKFWEDLFERPDPWNYESAYEQIKYERTLSLLPDEPIRRALELACAEGHFTRQLASRVTTLLAADISQRALERARGRCGHLGNVEFRRLDFFDDPLPGDMDLIVCSEVLYYAEDLVKLRRIAEKLRSALAPGGRILTAHAFIITDDPARTGFNWDHAFGAETIARVFGETAELWLEKSIVTEVYRVDIFVRTTAQPSHPPKVEELAVGTPLEPEVERYLMRGGVVKLRSDALRTEVSDSIPILMYHRITEDGLGPLAPYHVHPGAFEEQLRFLRRCGYYTVTSADLLRASRTREPFRGRPVMLTFDDGYRDFLETAWPILERYDFVAEVFLVTERIGESAEWDREYGEPAPLLSWDDVKRLSAKGVRFGSHLATHRAADGLDTEEILREGASSRASLERHLNQEIRNVALPFGAIDDRVVSCLRICGYRVGYTTRPGFASIRDNPMYLPRIEISGEDKIVEFARKLERLPELRLHP